MATNVRLSEKYSLDWVDAFKGGLLAAITAVLGIFIDALGKGGFQAIDWNAIATTAVVVFVGYLLKNGVFEPPKVITTVESNDKAKQVKSEINKAL